jgi:hypothetical protein
MDSQTFFAGMGLSAAIAAFLLFTLCIQCSIRVGIVACGPFLVAGILVGALAEKFESAPGAMGFAAGCIIAAVMFLSGALVHHLLPKDQST